MTPLDWIREGAAFAALSIFTLVACGYLDAIPTLWS